MRTRKSKKWLAVLAAMVITATAAFTVSVGNKSNKAEAAVADQAGYWYVVSPSNPSVFSPSVSLLSPAQFGTTLKTISEFTPYYVRLPNNSEVTGTQFYISSAVTSMNSTIIVPYVQYYTSGNFCLYANNTTSYPITLSFFAPIASASPTLNVGCSFKIDSSTYIVQFVAYPVAQVAAPSDSDQIIEDYKNSDQFETDVKASEWYQALETQVNTLTTQIGTLNSQVSELEATINSLEAQFEGTTTLYVHYFPTMNVPELSALSATSFYSVQSVGLASTPSSMIGSFVSQSPLYVQYTPALSGTGGSSSLLFSNRSSAPSASDFGKYTPYWYSSQQTVTVTYQIKINNTVYNLSRSSTSSATVNALIVGNGGDTGEVIELERQITALQAQVSELQEDVDYWQGLYNNLSANSVSKTQYDNLNAEYTSLQTQYQSLSSTASALQLEVYRLTNLVSTAEQEGYDRGLEEGYDNGYTVGYGKGVTASQAQSLATWDGFFPSLFGSIAGFFVTVLGGTTIFGFSLWQLLLSVLAVIAIVAILRVFLR